jgi:hypothetical protein
MNLARSPIYLAIRLKQGEERIQTSVMLLEAVACLRGLTEIVMRHERLLAAKNNDPSEAAISTLSIGDQSRSIGDVVPQRKPFPAAVSFVLSAVASVSGLVLAYGLFLR